MYLYANGVDEWIEVEENVALSKIRFLKSLKLHRNLLRIISNQVSSTGSLVSILEIFGSSSLEEAKSIARETRIRRIFNYRPSIHSISRTLFFGLVLRVYRSHNSNFGYSTKVAHQMIARKTLPEQNIRSQMANNIKPKSYSNSQIEDYWNKQVKASLGKYSYKKLRFSDKKNLTFENATVYANGLIHDRDSAVWIADPSVNKKISFTAGLQKCLVPKSMEGGYALINLSTNVTKQLGDETLFLSSRCSTNYWHAMIEDGCRLMNFINQNGETMDSLVINESTPRAAKEMYELIAPQLKIVYIQEDEGINCDRVTVPVGKTVIYDQPHAGINSIFIPDKSSLLEYRQLVKKKFPNFSQGPLRNIYIQRKSSYRNLFGEQKLIRKLIEQKFEIIDLTNYSVLEQHEIFSNSRKIIGLAGAAWANFIFASQETKFLSLIGQDAAPWDMHQKIAELFDLDYRQLILEHSLDDGLNYSDYLHRNVKITSEQIDEVLYWTNS